MRRRPYAQTQTQPQVARPPAIPLPEYFGLAADFDYEACAALLSRKETIRERYIFAFSYATAFVIVALVYLSGDSHCLV